MFYRVFAFLLASLAYGGQARAQVVPTELVLGDVKIALPAPIRPLVKLKVLEIKDSDGFAQKLADADMYLPVVAEILEEQGIPEAFKYLAFFDHTNPQDKVFWQIPEKLSNELNLEKENGIDETASLTSVAKAVAQQLKTNQGSLKNWLLTLISYHEGAGKAQNYFATKLEQVNLQNLILNKRLDLSDNMHEDVLSFVAHWIVFQDILGKNPQPTATLARYKTPENKTLTQIAEDLQINPQTLNALNEWIEPDMPIPAGKAYEVLIPLSTESPSAEVEIITLRGGEFEYRTVEETSSEEFNQTYTVRSGDTFFGIARQYGVSVADIRAWNLFGANHVLKPGDEIRIGTTLPANAPEKTKQKPKEMPTKDTQAGKAHIVASGETLSKIARQHNVTIANIRAWNSLTSDNLKIGQKIIIQNTLPAPITTKPKPAEKPAPTPTGLAYHQRTLNAKTVPSQMTALEMQLNITPQAQGMIQKYVDKLLEYPPHYFKILDRADGYMPLIEQELQKAGLPLDFRLLAMQESALIGNAVSKSKAIGYWQFKEPSAKEEGLIINVSIDERMNIVASTKAAVNYLKKSQLMFDNWVNSMLSYNMGRTGANNEIAKTYKNQKLQGAKVMQIHANTHWYVLKFLAHMVAFDDELGLSSPTVPLTTYTEGAKKTLAEIAKENKTTLEALKPHNFWLKTSAVPVGKTFPVIVIDK